MGLRDVLGSSGGDTSEEDLEAAEEYDSTVRDGGGGSSSSTASTSSSSSREADRQAVESYKGSTRSSSSGSSSSSSSSREADQQAVEEYKESTRSSGSSSSSSSSSESSSREADRQAVDQYKDAVRDAKQQQSETVDRGTTVLADSPNKFRTVEERLKQTSDPSQISITETSSGDGVVAEYTANGREYRQEFRFENRDRLASLKENARARKTDSGIEYLDAVRYNDATGAYADERQMALVEADIRNRFDDAPAYSVTQADGYDDVYVADVEFGDSTYTRYFSFGSLENEEVLSEGDRLTDPNPGGDVPETAPQNRKNPSSPSARASPDNPRDTQAVERYKASVTDATATPPPDQPRQEEQFGDIPVINPFTGNRVEDDLENASKAYRNQTDPLVDYISEGADAPSASAIGTPFNPGFVGGLTREARNTLDPFAFAAFLKEGAEFGITQPNRVLMGDGPGFAEDVSGRGSAAADAFMEAARDDPADLAGSILGATATGAAVGSLGSRGTRSAAVRIAEADVEAGGARAGAFFSDTRGQGQLFRSLDDAGDGAAERTVLSADDIADPINDRSDLARQAQEQTDFETAKRYGEEKLDKVPEYEEQRTYDPGPGSDSSKDIDGGLSKSQSTEPDLLDTDYPLGRTVEENFRNSRRVGNVPEDDIRSVVDVERRLVDDANAGSGVRADAVGGVALAVQGDSTDTSPSPLGPDAARPEVLDLFEEEDGPGRGGPVEETVTIVDPTVDSQQTAQPEVSDDLDGTFVGIDLGPDVGVGQAQEPEVTEGMDSDQPVDDLSITREAVDTGDDVATASDTTTRQTTRTPGTPQEPTPRPPTLIPTLETPPRGPEQTPDPSRPFVPDYPTRRRPPRPPEGGETAVGVGSVFDAAGWDDVDDDGDDLYAPGWYSETVADIATRGQRSQETLPQDRLAGLTVGFGGELPTFEEVEGTPEQKKSIEDTKSFLSFGYYDDDDGVEEGGWFGVGGWF